MPLKADTHIPASVESLKGSRACVTAKDRGQAIRIAETKQWWPRVLEASRPRPVFERGKWWFVVSDDPIRGLEEFARQARTVSPDEISEGSDNTDKEG